MPGLVPNPMPSWYRIPAAVALLAALAGAVRAEDEVLVTEVEYRGAVTTYPDRIRDITTVRGGRTYRQGDLPVFLADDVKAITRMGPFSGTQVAVVPSATPGKVKVVFTVTELPLVGELTWEGISPWDESDYKKVIDTRKGGYANPLIIENDRRALEVHLQEQGNRYVQVRQRQEPMPGGVRLIFTIDTGPSVKVGRLRFEGLPQGAKPDLFANGQTLPQGLLNDRGRPYIEEFAELDRGAIGGVLQDQGWLDCLVPEVRAEVTDYVRPLDRRARGGPQLVPDGEHDDRVVLIYQIVPGTRWKLGTVSFVGNTVATTEALREAFALEEGAWFKKADIRRAIERARRVISNQGYARCRAIPDRRLDYDQHVVHLTIHLDEGRKYRIGRVDFSGNTATRDPVIRRAMQLHPGDWWNDDAKDASERQILRTGIFRDSPSRPLGVEPRFPADRPDQADLLVALDEDSTGSLSFQLGYSSAIGFFGQLGYTERNFDLLGALGMEAWRGAGQTLDLGASVSQERSSLSAGWTNPHLADGPYSLSVSGARSQSSLRDWDETRLAGSIGIGRSFFTEDLRVTTTYGYTDLRVDNPSVNAPDDAHSGTFFLNSLGLSASFDRINNPRLPTSGYSLGVGDTVYGGFMASSADFHEATARGEGFVPMFESEDGGVWFTRFAAKWRSEYPLGAGDTVPFYQRYLGGGPGPRFRGFGYNQLSPKQVNRNGNVALAGGDTDVVATVEFSAPVQGTNDGVRGVLFIDWGNVWGVDETVSLGGLRSAYGFGVRFPMQFPIALDFAWLSNPAGGESASQIHFGIGQFRF